VIAYAGQERSNYCVTRKELLCVVYFTKHFRQYLLRRRFVIRTDHAALSWLKRTPEPIPQNAQWLLLLGEYDFDVQHRPGARHGNAGAMSRHPCLNQPSCTACHTETSQCRAIETDTPTIFGGPANHPTISSENDSKLQPTDVNLGPLITMLDSSPERPQWSAVELQSAETKTL